MKRVACGVIGVGGLGQHHVRIYKTLESADLVGIFDVNARRMHEIGERFSVRCFNRLESLLDNVEALSVAIPTSKHYEVGKLILKAGKHLLIEKPITSTVEEGEELVHLAAKKGVILYVGHSERFSAPMRTARRWIRNPRFIEALRLAAFGRRGTDVSVIHDLMIHDIDLVLSIVSSEVSSVEAVGVPVFTSSVDIANARLCFGNGTIASLTASRVSLDRLRKVRFFQPDAYISVDLLGKSVKIHRKKDNASSLLNNQVDEWRMQDLIEELNPSVDDEEPLMLEINDFLLSVLGEKKPEVTGEDGVKALRVASKIIQNIEDHLRSWSQECPEELY